MPHNEGWPDHPYAGTPGADYSDDEPTEPVCHGCGERIPKSAGGLVGDFDYCEPCYHEERAACS